MVALAEPRETEGFRTEARRRMIQGRRFNFVEGARIVERHRGAASSKLTS